MMEYPVQPTGRRRRICSGGFQTKATQKKTLKPYGSKNIPSLDGMLTVPRSYIPSNYDTTVEVTIDFELCYKVYRPDELLSSTKAPIVVVHGGPSIPCDYLFPLLDFIEDRTIIFFDQIGCGKSSIPTDINA